MNQITKAMALLAVVVVAVAGTSVVIDGSNAADADLSQLIAESNGTVELQSGATYTFDDEMNNQVFGELTIIGNGATVSLSSNPYLSASYADSIQHILTISDVNFVAADGTAITELNLYYWDDLTIQDCTFEDVKVFVGKLKDDTGPLSANIIGCDLHTDASDTGYAITLNAGNLMVIDNIVEGYGRGINMNVSCGDGSIVVANNQVGGLTNAKKPVAFQISQDAGERSPLFQGNTVGEGCIGLSIYFDFDTTGSVVLMYNKFTDCVADILYSFDGQEDNQQYDTPITLVDNNITHGGTEGVVYASEISETDGKEYGDVPSEDQATVDGSVTEASSGYIPGQDFIINDEDDLREFAMLVNSGIDFEGLTVTLTASIITDSWTPIGIGIVTEAGITGTPFRGTFVGNGNTLRNHHRGRWPRYRRTLRIRRRRRDQQCGRGRRNQYRRPPGGRYRGYRHERFRHQRMQRQRDHLLRRHRDGWRGRHRGYHPVQRHREGDGDFQL